MKGQLFFVPRGSFWVKKGFRFGVDSSAQRRCSDPPTPYATSRGPRVRPGWPALALNPARPAAHTHTLTVPAYCALTLSRILRPHTVTYSLPRVKGFRVDYSSALGAAATVRVRAPLSTFGYLYLC